MKNSKNHFLFGTSAIQPDKSIYVLACLFLLIGCIAIDSRAQSNNSKSIPVFNSQVKAIKPPLTDPYTSVRCSLQDKAGNLWFGTTGAGVYRYDGKSFTNFTEKDGLLNKVVYSMIEDKAGSIWAATEDGAYRYDGKKFSHFPLAGIEHINYNFFQAAYQFKTFVKAKQGNNPIYSIIQDKIGNIWFGTGKYGLCCYNGQTFTNFSYVEKQWRMVSEDNILSDADFYKQAIQYLYEDTQGNILFSSMAHGVFMYNGKTITKLKTDNSFKGGVFCMAEDKKGKLWFAVEDEGVYCYDGGSIENFARKDGFCKYITCAMADKKGNIWFGSTHADDKGRTQGCISRYDGKTFTSFPLDGLENTSIWNIFEDRSGNVWIGSRNVGIYQYDGRSITDFTEKPAKQ